MDDYDPAAMEEIKTNFEKIMEQFSDSISQNMSARKLSYEYLNNSFEGSVPKKRKHSPDKNDLNTSKTANDSEENNVSHESFNSSLLSSPWEARRMKADLLEAKTRITKLKQEIEHQHTIRSNMEIMYTNKVTALQKQCDYTSNKALDMEKHLNALRKRENAAKTELVKIKNQLHQQKQLYDEKLFDLQRANADIEESARAVQNKLSNELGEYRRLCDKLKMDLDLERHELDNLKSTLKDLKEKAANYDSVKAQLDTEKQQHELAKSKIKQLEYELESYGEWKELSKNSQNRLSTLPDIEKEVARLRQENKNLRDSLGNKLLLEEQVFDLKSRLEKYELHSSDAVALKVQVESLQIELKDWKKIAEDHCTQNSLITPALLRSRIEEILQKDIILSSEKGDTQSEKDTYKNQIHELQTQNEMYTKTINELKVTLKNHKNIMLRLQKKLMLVAKERDCYKQLSENFEKDLTISGALMDTVNPDTQLKARLDMLEKTLCAYKEMNANLEKELAESRNLPDVPLDMPLNTESYDRLRKEIETLRLENERIRRRKEELEMEMEHRCLKGDFNIDKVKVLHLASNPANEAYQHYQNEIEKLQAEAERLKRKIRKLEEDKEEMTTRLNDTTSNMTVNIKEINTLRSKLESMENKMQHMKDVYKSATLEFREVCYMLFGYRVDRVGNTNYRISSMYAENEDDYLNFRLNESGILDMLETEYSVSLGDMMQTHLGAHKSLPAFLSALTLELFNRVTLTV